MISTSAVRGSFEVGTSSLIATRNRTRLVAPVVLGGFLLLGEFESIASAPWLRYRAEHW